MSVLPHMMKPMVAPHYPHMMAEDVAVWTEFLKDPPVRIEGVWYDLHVGKAMVVADRRDRLDVAVAAGVSRKRVDVVALTPAGYWVIEVKPWASYLALGQALTYARLFFLEYEPVKKVIPAVVCSEVDEDVLDDFESLGVILVKV